MSLIAILLIAILLYFRTWKYKLLIDDPVPRNGYLYELPRKVEPSWYDKQRPILATVTNLGVFLTSIGYIYVLYGWRPALLYAVFPLCTLSVCWITGNYYQTTALLILATIYCLENASLLILILGMCFYAAALNSTINSLFFFAWSTVVYPYGWAMLWPFIFYITGKRFRTGIKMRTEGHEKIGKPVRFTWNNLLNIPKVIAYYAYMSLLPLRLGFFHSYGSNLWFFKKNFFWTSIAFCIAFVTFLGYFNWEMALFWLLAVGQFTHFRGHMGQFVTERYVTVANIAFCVIIGEMLEYSNVLLAVLATTWFWRSWKYTEAWKDNYNLFANSISNFPTAPENYTNYSSYLLERGRWIEAIKPLLLCLRYSEGNNAKIHVNLAKCYGAMRKYDAALHHTEMAMKTIEKDKYRDLELQKEELERRLKEINRMNRHLFNK